MTLFRYKAVTRDGKTVRDTIEAESSRQALLLLQERCLTPLHLTEASASPLLPSLQRLSACLHPISKAEVTACIRQLTTLLTAGLPLDEALNLLCSNDRQGRLRDVLARIRAAIVEGATFADSLARFPEVFSSTFVTMVRAGEASGTLDIVMERYAEHMEEQMGLIRKVQTALAYPLLMLVVGCGVVVFLLTFVVPKVTQIFTDMHRALPLPTQILLTLSELFRSSGWILGAAFVLLGFGLWKWLHTAKGKRYMARTLLRCPGIRGIYRPMVVGQMTRTTGMLLKNGVPLLKSLRIVRSVSTNDILGESIDNMYDGVQTGKDLSFFMTNPTLFSPMERQMVAAGERSGQLGEMLLWVAKDCEARVATRLQIAASLLEPLMILFLGSIVGFVVIAVMLPLFEMSTLAG